MDDPFFDQSYRRVIPVKRPSTNTTEEYLLKRLDSHGYLSVAETSREERAMLHALAARGVVRLEGDRYVRMLLG